MNARKLLVIVILSLALSACGNPRNWNNEVRTGYSGVQAVVCDPALVSIGATDKLCQ